VSAGQFAALIAAGFFAVGMCALVFVLLRLAGLISHANRIMTDYGDRAGTLIDRGMDEVTSNMADLSGHVADLAGLARGISAGLGTPLLRVSAFVFGVRRAVWLRRPARPAPVAAATQREALPAGRSAGPHTDLPEQRGTPPRQRGWGSGRREVRR
jgi:hypothetical protein